MVLSAPADRFKGASHDGYSGNVLYQLAAPDPELMNARFRGTSHDGYAKSILEDVRISNSGLVIVIR